MRKALDAGTWVNPGPDVLAVTRIVRWTSLGLAAAIALGWAGLFSLYLRGRLVLGHWPRVSADDPKQFGEGLHHSLAGYSTATFAICTAAVFFILAMLAGLEQKGARTAKVIAIATALASLLLIVTTRLVWWYLD